MTLYLDSMQWIYFFEQNPQFHPAIRALIARARAAHYVFHSSQLVLAEVLVIPKRNADVFTATKYRRLFLSPSVAIIPFDNEVAERFADLRAFTRVKPADALHLALAACAGTDYFVTSDTKLRGLTIPGIGAICAPEDVL